MFLNIDLKYLNINCIGIVQFRMNKTRFESSWFKIKPVRFGTVSYSKQLKSLNRLFLSNSLEEDD